MGKNSRFKRKTKKNHSQSTNPTTTILEGHNTVDYSTTPAKDDTEHIKDTAYEFILELALDKYNYEIQREQDLVQQSGQMQAAFSFMTAALFMALPVIVEYRGSIPLTFFLISASIITFFLLISLVLASAATWRRKHDAVDNISVIRKTIVSETDLSKITKKYNRLATRVETLEKVQVSKEKINNIRAKLIRASMLFFYASVGSIAINYIIAIILLIS